MSGPNTTSVHSNTFLDISIPTKSFFACQLKTQISDFRGSASPSPSAYSSLSWGERNAAARRRVEEEYLSRCRAVQRSAAKTAAASSSLPLTSPPPISSNQNDELVSFAAEFFHGLLGNFSRNLQPTFAELKLEKLEYGSLVSEHVEINT